MGVLDFLFEGSAPTAATGTQTIQTQLPEWYSQYTKDMLGKAQAVSNLPYAQYGGPRIAGFTPTEQAGFAATKEAAEAFKPSLAQAGAALGKAGGVSGMGAAQPYLAGAATTFPQAVGQYMSPYTENVVNRIADVGLRQLQEKFLPEVSQTFIEAGQFGPGRGSSRMGEFGARALRDVQEAVLGQQAQALESGYKTAGELYGADVSRMADLARVAGGLGAQDVQNLMGLAGKYGELGGAAQQMGLKGAEALTGAGAMQRGMQQANLDLAYQDFLRQQGYPSEQVKFLGDVLKGVEIPKTEITQKTEMPALPGSASGIEKALSGLTGVGTIVDLLKKYFPSTKSPTGFDVGSVDYINELKKLGIIK
jgi:hypothetical protein